MMEHFLKKSKVPQKKPEPSMRLLQAGEKYTSFTFNLNLSVSLKQTCHEIRLLFAKKGDQNKCH